MTPEIIQIVLPLTFLGVCGLVGEILIQCRRDKAADERLQAPPLWQKGPHSAKKVRENAAAKK